MDTNDLARHGWGGLELELNLLSVLARSSHCDEHLTRHVRKMKQYNRGYTARASSLFGMIARRDDYDCTAIHSFTSC